MSSVGLVAPEMRWYGASLNHWTVAGVALVYTTDTETGSPALTVIDGGGCSVITGPISVTVATLLTISPDEFENRARYCQPS